MRAFKEKCRAFRSVRLCCTSAREPLAACSKKGHERVKRAGTCGLCIGIRAAYKREFCG